MTKEELARYMEWERVQGGLRAILASYDDCSDEGYGHWVELQREVDAFIVSFGGHSGID